MIEDVPSRFLMMKIHSTLSGLNYDRLRFSYNGNQVESVTNDTEGEDFYGRTGYGAPATNGSYRWNAQGFMTNDTSRGITDIKYNFQGLPTTISFGLATSETNAYDASGRSLQAPIKVPGELFSTAATMKRDGCL